MTTTLQTCQPSRASHLAGKWQGLASSTCVDNPKTHCPLQMSLRVYPS